MCPCVQVSVCWSGSTALSHVRVLCTDIDKVTHKKMAYFRDLGLALQTMASHANCINVTDLVLLLCQLTSNVFSILDQDLNPTGEGLFIGPSFLNHSCVPNCAIVFEGKTLTVRVISPIPSGQQVSPPLTQHPPPSTSHPTPLTQHPPPLTQRLSPLSLIHI